MVTAKVLAKIVRACVLENSDPKARILDKDRFRQDLGGVIDAYEEILKRIEKDSSNAS